MRTKDLDALLHVMEGKHPGSVKSYVRFDNQHPLRPLHYVTNPRELDDPDTHMKFTAQVKDALITLTFPLDHAFMTAFHERTADSDYEAYTRMVQEVTINPDAQQRMTQRPLQYHVPPTGRVRLVRVAYVLKGADSTLQFRTESAADAARFLDILLGIDITLWVEARLIDPDPHAALRRLVELANRF